MKLIFVLFLFQLTGLVEAQNKEDKISRLDERCAEIIRQLSNCTNTVEVSHNFGVRVRHVCLGTIQVIALKVQQDRILKKVIWILEKDQLIYAQQEWLNVKSNQLTDSQKFYLENKSLIAWLNNKTLVDMNSADFKTTEKELLDYVPNLLKQ